MLFNYSLLTVCLTASSSLLLPALAAPIPTSNQLAQMQAPHPSRAVLTRRGKGDSKHDDGEGDPLLTHEEFSNDDSSAAGPPVRPSLSRTETFKKGIAGGPPLTPDPGEQRRPSLPFRKYAQLDETRGHGDGHDNNNNNLGTAPGNVPPSGKTEVVTPDTVVPRFPARRTPEELAQDAHIAKLMSQPIPPEQQLTEAKIKASEPRNRNEMAQNMNTVLKSKGFPKGASGSLLYKKGMATLEKAFPREREPVHDTIVPRPDGI